MFKAYYVNDFNQEVTLFTGTEEECLQYKKDNVYYSIPHFVRENNNIIEPYHVAPSPSRYLIHVKGGE